MAAQEQLNTSDISALVTFCEMAADTVKFNLLISAFAPHNTPQEFRTNYEANKANYINNFREIHNLFTVLNVANATECKAESMERMLDRIKNFKHQDLKAFMDLIRDNYLAAKNAFEQLKAERPDIGKQAIDVISDREANQAVTDIPFTDEESYKSSGYSFTGNQPRTVAGGTPTYAYQDQPRYQSDANGYLDRLHTNEQENNDRIARVRQELMGGNAGQQPVTNATPASAPTAQSQAGNKGSKPSINDLIMNAMINA